MRWATAPSRPLARVWRMMLNLFDDESNARDVVWMPAHIAEHNVGRRVIGNGNLLTAADRHGNAVADELAKRGATQWRAPMAVRAKMVAAHDAGSFYVVREQLWIRAVSGFAACGPCCRGVRLQAATLHRPSTAPSPPRRPRGPCSR